MSARRQVAVASALGAIAFVAYFLTLYPNLPGGDAGELIAASASGGVIHPPGYPLYALLGRVLSALPWGTLAWRFNLLSAICDAAAAALLCSAVWRWTRSAWAGIAAGALFAFAPGTWQYAISAEVFSLNNLFVALLILLTVLYTETKRFRLALAGAFAIGLALSNHHTALFTALPLTAWVLWVGRAELLQPTRIALLFAAGLAGLLPYLYLPIAAGHEAIVSWGAAGTWSGFWTHVLRREYGTLHLAVPGLTGVSTPGEMIGAWCRDAIAQLGWLSLAVPLGIALSWRERGLGRALVVPPLICVLVMVVFGNLPVSDPLHRDIVARFWQQPNIYCFAWCGWGLAALGRWIPWPLFTPVACTAAAVLQLALHYGAADRHTSRVVHDYGAEMLRVIPQGALVISKGDLITNSLRYLQLAEGLRPDVRVIDQELLGFSWERARLAARYPDVTFPADRYAPGARDGFFMVQLLDANYGRFPIVVCGGIRDGDLTAERKYVRWPVGLCEVVRRRDEDVDTNQWIADSEKALPHIDFTQQAHTPGSWEGIVWEDYWSARQMRAAHLINIAGADSSRRGYLKLAADILDGVTRDNPQSPPLVYKQLAIALGRYGLETAELRNKAADAWRHYLEIAPKNDPQLPAIERELAHLTSATELQTGPPSPTGSP